MKLSKEDLEILCNTAINAVKKAAGFISSYDKEKLTVKLKDKDGNDMPCGGSSIASQVVTEVDIKSQEIILQELNTSFEQYDLGLLTEEIVDDKSRFEKDFFWCIDPLDGTLPFSQGKEGYSVSIALIAQDGTPIIGVVCNPITQDVYHAINNAGAFKNGERWSPIDKKKNKVFTFINDRSFYKHPQYKSIVTSFNIELMQMGYSAFKMLRQGGAVMNAIWVLEKSPACYLKLPKKEKGGGSIWDFAATACIYKELGFTATDFNGDTLDLNPKETTFMNKKGIFFCIDRELIEKIKSFVN